MSYPRAFFPKLSAPDFEFDDSPIGDGNFCSVYKAHSSYNDEIVALKVLPKDQVGRLRKERDVLMEKHALSRYIYIYPSVIL